MLQYPIVICKIGNVDVYRLVSLIGINDVFNNIVQVIEMLNKSVDVDVRGNICFISNSID